MGQNVQGEAGLFPSNYVELVEDGQEEEEGTAPAHAGQQSHIDPTPSAPAGAGPGGPTATALYDYEAAEDNEISFPDGATIANVVSDVPLPSIAFRDLHNVQEFPDDDWWMGEYGGKSGLFPANYVQLDE